MWFACQLTNRAVLLTALIAYSTAVQARCDVTSTPLSFGTYDVFSATPVRSSATIGVTCTSGGVQLVTITVGPSIGSGGFNPRQMVQSGGADRLGYNLFIDPGLTQIWGDGTGTGSAVIVNVSNSQPFNGTAYGIIFARQNVSAGAYSDVLTVTINR
jgi:spore coat protein U-like protein